tara:strand:- start:3605 stop:3898 length:294 start_codon:yes stop_codon:yes gene_type:complete
METKLKQKLTKDLFMKYPGDIIQGIGLAVSSILESKEDYDELKNGTQFLKEYAKDKTAQKSIEKLEKLIDIIGEQLEVQAEALRIIGEQVFSNFPKE